MFRILIMLNRCAAETTRKLCRNVIVFKDSQVLNQLQYKNNVAQRIELPEQTPSMKQINYIESLDGLPNWTTVKNEILSYEGNIKHKNIDAVVLKMLVSKKNFTMAISFVEYLNSSNDELSLGSINAILNVYIELGKVKQLSKEQKKYILDTYDYLYKKYKVLNESTCESLLHVLCIINEWEKALKVLDDLLLTSVPTHSAYSTIVAALFKNNQKKLAFKLIDQSILHKRPLQDKAYDEWIQHILREYKSDNDIIKHIDEIFKYLATNWITVTEITANRLRELYVTLNWDGKLAKIRNTDGYCSNCKNVLNPLTLSDEEFNQLQNNVKDKLLVGSDLLMKSTPQELKRFLDFMDRSPSFDVVLDALNICYTLGKASKTNKLHYLDHIVEKFVRKNKKVLVISRKHMLSWNKTLLQKIMYKASGFFTDDMSEDDPFFIMAAILSGPNTDLVTKDLLRTHKFNLMDENLKQLFIKWQWQHQWILRINNMNKPVLMPPPKYAPCAQKDSDTWHIPYADLPMTVAMTDSRTILNTNTWLCLKEKKKTVE